MGRVVVAFLSSVIVFVPLYAANDWTAIVPTLADAVMQISDTCSAFAIDNEREYVLTARHCASADPAQPTIVDLIPARVVADDVKRDLMVLQVPGLQRKALKLAAHDPATGEEVASYGYGGGYAKPMLRIAHVANRRISLLGLDGEWVMVDGAFVGGQSGSPVVNAQGEVVSIVQMSSDRMGIGRGAEEIRDRVGKWWGKSKP